jgi:hypothetical protein
MGFLDNSSVTVDAILTKRGRQILSQGGDFNITKFALSDEEIDYSLYDVTHPDGSDSYGAVIENMSLLEAAPNRQQFQSYLVENTLAGAKVLVPQTTYTNVTALTPIPITPNTTGAPAEVYIFTIENTNIVRFENASASKKLTAKSATLIAQSFGEPTPTATTIVNIQGFNSGLNASVTIVVKADTTATSDAGSTEETTGDSGGNGGGDYTPKFDN